MSKQSKQKANAVEDAFKELNQKIPPKKQAASLASVISPLDSKLGDRTMGPLIRRFSPSTTAATQFDSSMADSQITSKMSDVSMVLESSASKADEVKGPKDDESAAKHEMDANESKIIKQKVNDGKSELKRESEKSVAEEFEGVQAPSKTSPGVDAMDWQGSNKEGKQVGSESRSSKGSTKSDIGKIKDGDGVESLNESGAAEEPDEPITSLKDLTIGKLFIEGPLLLTVLRVIPQRPGGPNVHNIILQDECATVVRLPLWNKNRDYKAIFDDLVGQKILLSGVNLVEMKEAAQPYAPDRTFLHELNIDGDLQVKPVVPKVMKEFELLIDLPGMIGPVRGHVQVKIGKGVHIVSYNKQSYNAVIVHDNVKRFSLLFAAGVDVARLRKNTEIVIEKLRILRESASIASTVCMIESDADYKVIRSAFNQFAPLPNVRVLPELFVDVVRRA